MQSVLILGAGLLQRPSILAAKRLGCKAVVIDANSKAVCAPLSDEFHLIDLKDKEGILQLGKELKARDGGLAGVFTAGTDFSASVSYAAERLGLPSHSLLAALNASDKGRMRECFKRCGVPSPAFFVASDEAAGKEAALKLGFPCVVKPVDNMGARGCRMIRSADEAGEALKAALSSSRTGRAIIEEYMEGEEYSIDALVFDGTVTITGFADRHIYYPPYFIETGHTMPTAIDDEKRISLIQTFAQGIAALGLTHGAAKADIKWTKNGAMIGEIAGRLSGGYMSGWTYPYAAGLDLTEAALLLACGRKPEALIKGRASLGKVSCAACKDIAVFDYPCNATCAERAWISIPGAVKEVIGLDEAKATSGVKDIFPRTKAGDEADFPRNNVQKCGNVIAAAPSREAAVLAAESAAAKIVLRLEAHNKKTDDFLFGRAAEASEAGFPPNAYAADDIVMRQVAMLEGALHTNCKAQDAIPACLIPLAQSCERDFNRRTLMETLFLFDKLCKERTKDIAQSVFWTAVLRGGVQGALYAAE